MRIGVFTGTFPAASETFIANQAAGLVERGHDVEILVQTRGDTSVVHPVVSQHQLLDRVHAWPCRPRNRVLRLAKGWGLWLANVSRAPKIMFRSLNVRRFGRRALSLDLVVGNAALLDRPAFDLVHCHFGPSGLLAAQLSRTGALRCPLIVTFHGSDVLVTPRRLGAQVYRELFDRADLCTVGSEFMRERLLALGAPADRTIRLPMGVDLALFPYEPRLPRAAGARALRLITVARLVEGKGIEYGLRAVARLAAQFPLLRYDIIGAGPLAGDLAALADELGIGARVTFAGALPQNEVRSRLRQADIFLLPGVEDGRGWVEGQGVVLIEAQALGLPVIASSVGGIPESLPAINHELLVPPRDVEALAQCIAQLAERPGDWQAISAAGRRHVEENFSLANLNDRLVEVYREVIDRGVVNSP